MIGYLVCASTTGLITFLVLASPTTGRVEDPVLGSFPATNFVLFTTLIGAWWKVGVLPLVFCSLGLVTFTLRRKTA